MRTALPTLNPSMSGSAFNWMLILVYGTRFSEIQDNYGISWEMPPPNLRFSTLKVHAVGSKENMPWEKAKQDKMVV